MVFRKEKSHQSVLRALCYGLPEMGYPSLLVALAMKFLFTTIIFSNLRNNGFLQPSEGCWYETFESGHLRSLGAGGGGSPHLSDPRVGNNQGFEKWGLGTTHITITGALAKKADF